MFAFIGYSDRTLMAAFLSESVTIPVLCVILFGGGVVRLVVESDDSGE